MKILVDGAGIAGLSAAALLRQRGFEPVVIERASEWHDGIGYGLMIWSNGKRILAEMGLGERLDDEGSIVPHFTAVDTEGEIINRFYHPDNGIPASVGIERSKLLRMLRDVNAQTDIRMGTTISNILNTSDGAEVEFNNGTTEHFDLVIGADGIRSDLRQQVFGVDQPANYGWTTWFCWIPDSIPQEQGTMYYCGPGTLLLTYPTGQRTTGYFVTPGQPGLGDPPEQRIERLHQAFGNLHGKVADIIDAFESPDEIFHADMQYVKMKRWYKGRVVLTGDAEHAFSPVCGMGSSMAMEDAYVLAEEVARCKNGDPEPGLRAYEKRRKKRLASVKRASGTVFALTASRNYVSRMCKNAFLKITPMNTLEFYLKHVLNASI